MRDLDEWVSALYKAFEFLFYIGIDIASLVIAIKGYKRGELKRTWLFMILFLITGMSIYVISFLYFNIYTFIWGYDADRTLTSLILGINSFFSYVRYVLFLLMVIWLYKKK